MRDIKRRISSFKNMKQITKAMEMVSAAKLRRSQRQATEGRPFADKLQEVLVRLVESARGDSDAEIAHPLLEKREIKRTLYVAVTADRGLAGGYNANIIRRLATLLDEAKTEVGVVAIGRRGRDYLRKRGIVPVDEYVQMGDEIDYMEAKAIAGRLMQYFTSGQYDAIYLLYTQFVSAISHRPVVEQVLPITAPTGSGEGGSAAREYIYEPSGDSVLNMLLPRYVETEVYRALMEAKASEHAARMTAMRNASDNAQELIESLTLSFNRARQASITKEISEIVGGAEALAAE